MKKLFLCVIALLATSEVNHAATYSPVLGDLLSGNPASVSPQNQYNLKSTSYIGLESEVGPGGAPFSKSVVTTSTNGQFTQGDTFTSISAFTNLQSALFNGGNDPLGAGGFAALVWHAAVESTTSTAAYQGSVTLGQNDVGGSNTTLNDVMSNASDSTLSLFVSETVNFSDAGVSLADINTALGSGDVIEMASFDLTAGDITFTYIGDSTNLIYTASSLLSFDVTSNDPGDPEFWTLPKTGFNAVGDPEYQFGSFGSELWLNYSYGENLVSTGDLASAGQFALGGSGSAAMNPVPEPSSLLAIAGCFGVAGLVRRRRKSQKIA